MKSLKTTRLFVCYIPGMDLRRISPDNFPYVANLFGSYPWAKIKTLPSVELVPSLITGVYPHEHGIWQVKLKPRLNASFLDGILDRVPDIVTTTFQCVVHFFNQSFDLAAIPYRRRRAFDLKRFKYTRREKSKEILFRIGGVESIFSVLGREESIYVFNKKIKDLDSLFYRVCSGSYRLEFLELYALDILQHWNLDNPSRMKGFYTKVDNFVERLYKKCKTKGVILILLSDHGQEYVKGVIDIRKKLGGLDLSEDEYDFYIEVPMARFWFHTDRARNKITDMLHSMESGTVLSYRDMHRYNVKFEDKAYGELYFMAKPGYIFFPHDYYQPLANLFLGISDWQQRSRIFNPVHRGSHGYLPCSESEKGFIMILDNTYRVNRREVDIIDIAPSLLELVGYKRTPFMRGSSIFIQ
jgi:hypothetical protein